MSDDGVEIATTGDKLIMASACEQGSKFECKTELTKAVEEYLAALDAWNGPNGGTGVLECILQKAEERLRLLVGVPPWKGNYR